mgnify:CR=1 FL=1
MPEHNILAFPTSVNLLETTLAGKLPGLLLFIIVVTILGLLYDMLISLFRTKKHIESNNYRLLSVKNSS